MKIGIIGFGEMGRSLAAGFIKRGNIPENIQIYDNSERAIKKAVSLGVTSVDFDTLIENNETVIIALPKKAYLEMNFDKAKLEGKTVISCMAEVKFNELKNNLPAQVIRAIPTLAAENGVSIVGLCFGEYDGDKDVIRNMFSKVGTIVECVESELTQLTALAACGLCYAAYIMNCFINTAENLGFDRETGKEIVEKTFNAAMEMGDYELLIGKIAGRGGITIKGVDVMNEGNVHKKIDRAFKTVYAEFLK